MPRVIVVGGGLIGLATSLLIAKQGHDVTVLERDPEPPPKTPEEATGGWAALNLMVVPPTLIAAGLVIWHWTARTRLAPASA